MALLNMLNISAGYGGPPLLEGVNLQIERGERVCLLGRNGAGKTTLMKLVTGELPAELGTIDRQKGSCFARLEQQVPVGVSGTVFDEVAAGLGKQGELLSEFHHVSHQLAADSNPDLLARLERVQHELEAAGGWEIHHRTERIITEMDLDADAVFKFLSAGLKRRVLLAKSLVRNPDLLLLDEPTNHLDIEAISWLEDYLTRYSGTLLFVTHDRMFLRKLATRIVEIDLGQVISWSCDYETYLKRKEVNLEAEAKQQAEFDKKLNQEEAWLRRGIKARRVRNEGRVRRLKEMREQRRQRKDRDGTAGMILQDAQRTGRLVINAKNITYTYDKQPLIKDFSTLVLRGDKIGIIGPNGCGKTTLLQILLGELTPGEGEIRHGTKLQVAYFDQLHAQLDENKTAQDNVSDGHDMLTINGRKRHIIGYMEDFLFTRDQARGLVSELSGGERNRLLLARLFSKPSNVLVLDEPTNDLDLETLELLENLLVDYQGTILLVSHDRDFLNNVVTSTLVFEDNGSVKEYAGGYDDWLVQKKDANPAVQREVPKKKEKTPPRKIQTAAGLTYKEQGELEELTERIEILEARQKELHNLMADPQFFQKEGCEIAEATSELRKIEEELNLALDRWTELEERNE